MYVVCIDEENGQDTVCTSVNVIYNITWLVVNLHSRVEGGEKVQRRYNFHD